MTETLLGRLDRRIKPFGELIGGLTEVEIGNA
jgi:hypothetical protein